MVETAVKQNTISVFKTDISPYQRDYAIQLLAPFTAIKEVDIDFEDRDHILRIVSEGAIASRIESLLISKDIYSIPSIDALSLPLLYVIPTFIVIFLLWNSLSTVDPTIKHEE